MSDKTFTDILLSEVATIAADDELASVGLTTTIVPLRESGSRPGIELPALEGVEGDAGPFILKETLGQGGMGVVHLAHQRSLDRDVAVKRIRAEVASNSQNRRLLLWEARVTGALEHPNVLPIYALGVDGVGAPMIVMKRIEGVGLDVLLHHDDHPLWKRAGSGRLAFLTDVVMSVCDALAYAHDAGYVHRDIKPENIMIGRFGEVYLLDWGIALRHDPERPVRSEVLAGTPAYMAPEMVNASVGPLAPHTDVFLVGAVLYEMLTGNPPNNAENLMTTLLHADSAPEPEFADGVDRLLAEVCRRCMSRDPDDRPSSAAVLRQQLAQYHEARSSLSLTDEARAQLAELDRHVAADDVGGVYDTFGACRFGLQFALRSWPDNTEAGELLRRALVTMIRFEVRRENLGAAQALLADVQSPPEDLEAEVAGLAKRQKAAGADLARLREMEHQLDVDVGARSLSRLMLLLAAVTTLVPLVLAIAVELSMVDLESSRWSPLFVGLGLVGSVSVGMVVFRKRLWRNVATGRLMLALVIGLAGILTHRTIAVWQEQKIYEVLPMTVFIAALIVAVAGATVDRRLFAGFPFMFAALIVSVAVPEATLWAMAFGNLFCFTTISWMWHRAARVGRRRDVAFEQVSS